jgi:hypothetical protein
MTDDDCRGVRAHARALEEEVALTRAVVAALRASPRRRFNDASQRVQPTWKWVVVALIVGFASGAATLIALTRCP